MGERRQQVGAGLMCSDGFHFPSVSKGWFADVIQLSVLQHQAAGQLLHYPHAVSIPVPPHRYTTQLGLFLNTACIRVQRADRNLAGKAKWRIQLCSAHLCRAQGYDAELTTVSLGVRGKNTIIKLLRSTEHPPPSLSPLPEVSNWRYA